MNYKTTYPQFKNQDYAIPVFQVGGSALTNMPAGDAVEVLSDSASDTAKLTIFGTDNTYNLLKTETITMNGTSVVTTTETDWGNVYGFFIGDEFGKKSSVAVGTITVREASGNATIGTLSAGERSTGTMVFNAEGKNVILHNVSGNTYLNENDRKIYPTTNNSFKLTAQQSIDLRVNNYIYLLGDATGSTAQIMVYRD